MVVSHSCRSCIRSHLLLRIPIPNCKIKIQKPCQKINNQAATASATELPYAVLEAMGQSKH